MKLLIAYMVNTDLITKKGTMKGNVFVSENVTSYIKEVSDDTKIDEDFIEKERKERKQNMEKIHAENNKDYEKHINNLIILSVTKLDA